MSDDKPCKVSEFHHVRPTTRRFGRVVNQAVVVLEKKLGRRLTPGKLALHSCGNELCLEPDHIYEGTRSDNVEDAQHHGTYRHWGKKDY